MERISTATHQELGDKVASLFQNGVLAIYTGAQPASADDAERGTLLCLITRGGGAFTPGQPDNGLNVQFNSADNTIVKVDSESWSGEVIANGTPGWFRFYDNNYTTGKSTTAKRFDGSVGNDVFDEVQLNRTTMYPEDVIDILSFKITLQGT